MNARAILRALLRRCAVCHQALRRDESLVILGRRRAHPGCATCPTWCASDHLPGESHESRPLTLAGCTLFRRHDPESGLASVRVAGQVGIEENEIELTPREAIALGRRLTALGRDAAGAPRPPRTAKRTRKPRRTHATPLGHSPHATLGPR